MSAVLSRPSSQSRERKRDTLEKHGDDPSRTELRSVVESVSRCFGAASCDKGMSGPCLVSFDGNHGWESVGTADVNGKRL
jgi:hypothetical protein